jgi:hypothetical protein
MEMIIACSVTRRSTPQGGWGACARVTTTRAAKSTMSVRTARKTLTPQTLSSVIWRHFLHPEDKSLSPDGEFCNSYTRGLLLRRPVSAIKPLIPIAKEIERRSQEGEDISVLDNLGPIQYHARKTANTRPADALITRAKRFSKKLLRRKSGASQHAVDRFLRGERIHPSTRKKLAEAVADMEQDRAN